MNEINRVLSEYGIALSQKEKSDKKYIENPYLLIKWNEIETIGRQMDWEDERKKRVIEETVMQSLMSVLFNIHFEDLIKYKKKIKAKGDYLNIPKPFLEKVQFRYERSCGKFCFVYEKPFFDSEMFLGSDQGALKEEKETNRFIERLMPGYKLKKTFGDKTKVEQQIKKIVTEELVDVAGQLKKEDISCLKKDLVKAVFAEHRKMGEHLEMIVNA